jgi:hypothetical protein
VPGRIARNSCWLTASVGVGAAVVSAVSLRWPSIYREQDPWFRAVWHGNDWVTLVVAVPVLLLALVFACRGSRRGALITYGALGYMLYNYAYYLFGARINALFPAYVVLWVLAAIALMLSLPGVDAEKLAAAFEEPIWCEKVSASYMAFTGIGLGLAWIGQWVSIVFAGAKPSLGEQGFQLVAAMDLSFMVPFFLIGAVLLWLRRPWGYVVSAVIMTQGALYTLVLAVNSALMGAQGMAGGGEVYIWGAWTVLGAAALLLLLLGVGRRPGFEEA